MSIKDVVITPLLIAVQFMTVLPITLAKMPTPQQNAVSVLYYPLIGLMIGGLLLVVVSALSFLPSMALSAVVLGIWVYLTGGLHLDGLADMADGFVGGHGDKERTLDIMKDPHIGAMGVMVIVVALLCKFAFLVAILQNAQKSQLTMVLFAPILGRLMILWLLLTTPYVRKRGLGSALSAFLPKKLTMMVLGLSLFGVFVLPIKMALVVLLVFVLMGFYLRHWFIKRTGGITGDMLGAGVEMTEVGLLGCAMWL